MQLLLFGVIVRDCRKRLVPRTVAYVVPRTATGQKATG